MMKDSIERQMAINEINRICPVDTEYDCVLLDRVDVICVLSDLPSAEQEQKIGYWKRYNTYHGDDTSGFVDPDWRCSECGKRANINEWFMYDLTAFCPNCGARMEVKNETN